MLEALRTLSLLAESELTVSEISDMVEESQSLTARTLRDLESRGFVIKKMFIGGDILYSITQEGIDYLAQVYPILIDLVNRIEEGVCSRYPC